MHEHPRLGIEHAHPILLVVHRRVVRDVEQRRQRHPLLAQPQDVPREHLAQRRALAIVCHREAGVVLGQTLVEPERRRLHRVVHHLVHVFVVHGAEVFEAVSREGDEVCRRSADEEPSDGLGLALVLRLERVVRLLDS